MNSKAREHLRNSYLYFRLCCVIAVKQKIFIQNVCCSAASRILCARKSSIQILPGYSASALEVRFRSLNIGRQCCDQYPCCEGINSQSYLVSSTQFEFATIQEKGKSFTILQGSSVVSVCILIIDCTQRKLHFFSRLLLIREQFMWLKT